MAVLCPTCESEAPPGSAFCESCGGRLPAMAAADSLAVPAPSGPSAVATVTVSTPNGAGPSPGAAAADPVVGQATPNSTYLGVRLQYSEDPHDLDPLTNRDYLKAVLVKAFLFSVLWWGGLTVEGLLFFLAGRSSGAQPNGFGDLLVAVLVIGSLLLACLFWLTRVPALVSDWKLTIDGSGGSAAAVLDHMAWIVRGRRTPVDSLKAKRLHVPGQPPRVYLELRHGFHTGYVSSFGYGEDLFLGWTFWLHMAPARWVLLAWGRLLQALTMRGSDLYVTLRYDAAKALRETIHSAMRQGADVATGHAQASGAGTIGSVLPVEAATIKSF